jgi:hypothetical protein
MDVKIAITSQRLKYDMLCLCPSITLSTQEIYNEMMPILTCDYFLLYLKPHQHHLLPGLVQGTNLASLPLQ